MGFFKKETKLVVVDGKYQFTDIELAVKNYADLQFSIGNYEIASKEYKVLIDEIKKKTADWTSLILEKQIYCSLAMLNLEDYPKSKLKQIDSMIIESCDKILNNYKHRVLRLACLKNVLIHLQYELTGSANPDFVYDLSSVLQKEIKSKFRSLEFLLMIPIFMEQIARYSILKENKCLRKFLFLNVNAASQYTKEREIALPAHAKACLIVATKFYDTLPENSFSLIIELAFFNLGGIYLEEKEGQLKALECYIRVANNKSRAGDETVKKALDKVKSIYKGIEQGVEILQLDQSDKAIAIMKKNLRVLEISDADLITQNEVLVDLGTEKSEEEEKTAADTVDQSFLTESNFSCKKFLT